MSGCHQPLDLTTVHLPGQCKCVFCLDKKLDGEISKRRELQDYCLIDLTSKIENLEGLAKFNMSKEVQELFNSQFRMIKNKMEIFESQIDALTDMYKEISLKHAKLMELIKS